MPYLQFASLQKSHTLSPAFQFDGKKLSVRGTNYREFTAPQLSGLQFLRQRVNGRGCVSPQESLRPA